MRWMKTLICALAPLALAACAGGPDFEAMTDHPGHPSANASPASVLPGVLAIPDVAGPAAGDPSASAAGAEAVVYTCPMHPEIVRSEPGSCPICGMALVPKTPAQQADAAAEEDPHAHH